MRITFTRNNTGAEEAHKAGCQDIKKQRAGEIIYTSEFSSRDKAALDYWSDFLDEWKQEDADAHSATDITEMAVGYINWMPCCSELPEHDEPVVEEMPLVETVQIRTTVAELRVGDVLDDFGVRTVTKIDSKPVWQVVWSDGWSKKMHRSSEINVTRNQETPAGREAKVIGFLTRRAENASEAAYAELRKGTANIAKGAAEDLPWRIDGTDMEKLAKAQAEVELWAKVKLVMKNTGCDILKACSEVRKMVEESELYYFRAANHSTSMMVNAFEAVKHDTIVLWHRENYGRTTMKEK